MRAAATEADLGRGRGMASQHSALIMARSSHSIQQSHDRVRVARLLTGVQANGRFSIGKEAVSDVSWEVTQADLQAMQAMGVRGASCFFHLQPEGPVSVCCLHACLLCR